MFLGEVAKRLGDTGDAFIISAGPLHHSFFSSPLVSSLNSRIESISSCCRNIKILKDYEIHDRFDYFVLNNASSNDNAVKTILREYNISF